MGSEWRKAKFSDLCSITRGGSPRPIHDYIQDSGIPWVKIADATGTGSRYIRKTKQFIKEAGKSKSREVFPGDLILSNSATPGIPRFMDTYACIHDGWMLLRDFKDIDKNFCYYLLTHERLNLVAQGNGSVFTNLKTDILKQHVVSLPPLPEQKAIAHILGSLDDKIELNRRMNETLEAMAQALFKSWFVDFDPVIDNALAAGNPIPEELADRAELRQKVLEEKGDATITPHHSQFPATFTHTEELGWIPEGWKLSCFGDVSECFDRKRIPLSKKQREAKKPGTIPYYGATSVMDYINEWIFDDTYLLIGEDGSVMHEDGSPFVQYIWDKTWVNNHAHVLQGVGSVSTEHLMLFMQSQDVAPFVTGAVQLKINQKNMNSIPFLNAGRELNEQFTSAIEPFYEKLKALRRGNETLTKLRDTLLPKLISGELRIPEAKKLTEDALA